MAGPVPEPEKPQKAAPVASGALRQLAGPLRLTLAGLWAERLCRAFWPLWTLGLLVFSALAFGLQDLATLLQLRLALGGLALAAVLALVLGLRKFRAPLRDEAIARLDASLPGRPLSALLDAQAIGATDPQSAAVWRVHQARMAAQLAGAKPVPPDLRLSSRDPFSLRYMALTSAVMAALFGSFWRAAEVSGLGPGAALAIPAGPAWEGWARPPAYTGQPTLYLNDSPAGELLIPVGSRIQIRLYGEAGGLGVAQTIAPVAPPGEAAEGAGEAEGSAALPGGLAGLSELVVSQSGRLEITGPGGREWQVIATPDLSPEIALSGEIGREADGRFRQAFTASDDYGVTGGEVTISLDLAKVSRRHGLAIAPEDFAPVVLDLPMPVKGDRSEIRQSLVDDLSDHVFANLPVEMSFTVRDAAGNTGRAAPQAVILPGKRFFDPHAAAVAEMRRDLLWNRENLARVSQLLKAIGHRPETLGAQKAAKRLRVAVRGMDKLATPLSDSDREVLAKELWAIAYLFEEGDLGSAAERLERAQQRLEEAMKNGASPEEVDELMQELQQAMRDYMRELSRQPRDPSQGGEGAEGREVTQDQIQQLLDEIERLTKEGKTAEAMEKMEQLRALMENLQMQQGSGEGDGEGEGGGGAMRDLGETLKDQQGLSDDAFRNMQRGRNGGSGGSGSPGEPGGDPGEAEGEEGREPGDLASRQRALREKLDELRNGRLPGDGSELGEEGRNRLDEAGRAMREAEEALREGDLSGALDRQAEAMQGLRQGIRDLADAREREERSPGGEGGDQPLREARRVDPNATDPLGREPGDSARIGSDRNMVGNEPDERAQQLLDEIRRRSGEAERPEAELDYLRRLLDLF